MSTHGHHLNKFGSSWVRDTVCEIYSLSGFPYKRLMKQIWRCRKTSQCQPKVTIWINLVALEYLIQHTKFKGRRPFGSREEDLLSSFIIYRYGGRIAHLTWTIWTNFRYPITWRLHMKFNFNRSSGLRGEDVCKCWYTHSHTHLRTTEACLYYKLNSEPSAQVS